MYAPSSNVIVIVQRIHNVEVLWNENGRTNERLAVGELRTRILFPAVGQKLVGLIEQKHRAEIENSNENPIFVSILRHGTTQNVEERAYAYRRGQQGVAILLRCLDCCAKSEYASVVFNA